MTSELPPEQQNQEQVKTPPQTETQGAVPTESAPSASIGTSQGKPTQAPTPPSAPPPPPCYYYPPPPPRGSWIGNVWRWGCGLGMAGCLLVVVFFLLAVLLAIARSTSGMRGGISVGEGQIALIRIDGIIIAGESGFSPFGGVASGSDEIIAQIERALKDDDVRAILLRVNSPGGSAAGSQEIYEAVKKAKVQKTVVVSMADVAASGGYYVSCAADQIWADPATITGSIGVIATHEDFSGLLSKIGVKSESIKSGKLKDMFSPMRPLSDDARQVMTSLIKDVYGQFVEAVAKGRNLKVERVKQLADGRIYLGTQAKKNGLVDEIGGLQEAMRAAAKLAGITGKPQLREYGPPSLLRWIFGSSESARSKITVSESPAPLLGNGLLYDDFAARLASGAVGRELQLSEK